MLEQNIYQETIDRLQQDLTTFSDRLGIMYDERPTLITLRQELLDTLVDSLPEDQKLCAREYFLRQLIFHDGQCFLQSRYKIVFVHVNPRRLKSYSEYRNTLGHEMLHYRFFNWNHNKKFDDAIDQLLYTSKTWPRTRLYLDLLSDDTTPVLKRPDKG